MPVPVNDAEIDAMRMCVARGGKLEPHPYIAVGDRVRVRDGAFEGLEGMVVRKSNSCKLIVSLSLIHQSVALEIEPEYLEIVKPVKVGGIRQPPIRQSESNIAAI
jgi:transcription antitermination factor NusG